MMKKFILFSMIVLTCFLNAVAIAKPLNLYDQPNSNAKKIGTIETDTGIIPIFTSKEGEWIKVGDPKNGNVGWVKRSDLQSISGIAVIQNVISTGQQPNSISVFQFGNPVNMTPAETEAMKKRMEKNQKAIQNATQQMIKDMFQNFQNAFGNSPIFMPVVIVPDQNKTTPTKPASEKK